ncbi:MAG TPA: hypothetical protein VF510_25230, partial [Ktedonobacterales bacterium]
MAARRPPNCLPIACQALATGRGSTAHSHPGKTTGNNSGNNSGNISGSLPRDDDHTRAIELQ